MTAVAPVESREAWDAFVAGHHDGGFLQSWRWGELKARYGWRAIRLALPRQDGGLAAGAQVLVRTRRLWPGGPQIGLAYVPRGPLAGSPGDAATVVRAAIRVAQEHGASFMRVEPPNDLVAEAVRACQFRPFNQFVQIPRTAMIDLERTESDILGGFKSKMRYNIRLAGRRGVEVSVAAEDADFEAFVDLMGVTASRERFAIHHPSYYRDVWQTFQPDQGALFIARYQGAPLAALIVVGAGRTAAYVFGGSSNQHRNLMAPHALQWAAMQRAKANGARTVVIDPARTPHRVRSGCDCRSLRKRQEERRCASRTRWAWASGVPRRRTVPLVPQGGHPAGGVHGRVHRRMPRGGGCRLRLRIVHVVVYP